MKITQKIEAVTIKEIVGGVVCNHCGMTFNAKTHGPFWEDFVHSFKAGFGYGSSQMDGESMYFDLCENCLLTFTASFVVKPVIKNYLKGSKEEFPS